MTKKGLFLLKRTIIRLQKTNKRATILFLSDLFFTILVKSSKESAKIKKYGQSGGFGTKWAIFAPQNTTKGVKIIFLAKFKQKRAKIQIYS